MEMILDTNALSAFFDGDPAVVGSISKADALHLPVIVIGEYRFGLRASRLRKRREPKLDALTRVCTVLPILESTTVVYASVRHELKRIGKPIPENDVWIAALALEYGLPILSDDKHFDAVKTVRRVAWQLD
jgi:tRNA(fMet)-specific endonuclease VapC